jgi:hypothetical protein
MYDGVRRSRALIALLTKNHLSRDRYVQAPMGAASHLVVTIRGVPESLRELLGVYRPQLKVSFPEHLHRVHAGRGGTTR